MSRGPVWIESTRADGTKRLRLGAYMSTWVLDRDGAWRVAVDGGQDPVEATEDEVAKSKAETPVGCLAGR
jgi:hypothetical protein